SITCTLGWYVTLAEPVPPRTYGDSVAVFEVGASADLRHPAVSATRATIARRCWRSMDPPQRRRDMTIFVTASALSFADSAGFPSSASMKMETTYGPTLAWVNAPSG